MTSKERVLKTINHQEADRVPVGEWGIDHDHVSKIIGRHTYWRNRKDTTLALWEGRRDEVVESLKKDCVELVEKLDYDIITVELVPPKGYKNPDPPRKVGEGVWEDSRGNIFKYAASNDSIQCMTYSEGREELTEEDISNAYQRAASIEDSIFELVDFIGDKYGKEKAVLFRDINIYGGLISPFGGDYNHQLMLTSLAPDEIKRMYGPELEYNKKLIEHCKSHNVLIAMQGQDFGMNSGCILSPHSLRDIVFPFIKTVNEEIVKAGMIPFFHCCGRIWDILDDYVASGYKGYQSVQQTAGMDWGKLKGKYGKQLTLWTGVQCETLVSGTMEDTEQEVGEALKTLMPGGGFIFGSTNSVQFGAKTDNYLKALEVVKEKGIY
jgi:uroporphyrinogen decarboxylase